MGEHAFANYVDEVSAPRELCRGLDKAPNAPIADTPAVPPSAGRASQCADWRFRAARVYTDE